MNVQDIRLDLIAEQSSLDELVSGLAPELFERPASIRWTVADQVAHLAYFDRAGAIAVSEPESFPDLVDSLWTAAAEGDESVDHLTVGRYRSLAAGELIDAWRADRGALAKASGTLTDERRIAWFGPPMGSKSFLTARLMECWAHGQDIADATGTKLLATDRLAHIARLGFITRGWSYTNRGMVAPVEPVAVQLTAPVTGKLWSYGSSDTDEVVIGPAEDFCSVVTQRAHLDDTALSATPLAREWLLIAQAFAGPPTDGPARAL